MLDADALDLGATQVLGCPRDHEAAGWRHLAGVKLPRDQQGVPTDKIVVVTVGVPETI